MKNCTFCILNFDIDIKWHLLFDLNIYVSMEKSIYMYLTYCYVQRQKSWEKLMRLLSRTSVGNDTIVGEVDAVRSLQRTCTLVTFYAKNA